MRYRKTRTGCLACKARKVKCDEAIPCTACVRRGSVCSLKAQERSPRSRTQSPRDQSTTPTLPTQHLPLITSSPTHLPLIAPLPTDKLAAEDRALLNHWHTIAFKSVVTQQDTQDLWQDEVTHLALHHPVILNIVLAISSFEQAHTAHHSSTELKANRRRRDVCAHRGFKYSQNAVVMMRHTVSKANRENGAMCHLASILMLISSYAEGCLKELLRDEKQPSSMLRDLLVTCKLTRGSKAIADTFGIIRPERREKVLFVSEAEPPEHGPLDPILRLLDSLAFLNDERDPVVRRICQDALDLMRWLVAKAQTSEWWPAHRASLQWACFVSQDFVRLWEACEPAALVVVSYGCFLANGHVGDSFIMTGWKEGVCAEIREMVGPNWAWAVAR